MRKYAALRSEYSPPVFSLVLSNWLRFGVPASTTLCRPGFLHFSEDKGCQYAELDKDERDFFDSPFNHEQLSNRWLNNWQVMLDIVSSHVLLKRKEQFKAVILGVELQ